MYIGHIGHHWHHTPIDLWRKHYNSLNSVAPIKHPLSNVKFNIYKSRLKNSSQNLKLFIIDIGLLI